MGVSSERVGPVRGSAGNKTHGAEETTPDLPVDEDPVPEQSVDPTRPEVHPANDLPPHRAGRKPAIGHAPR
jgi:hypothetical protein